jgi:hypothetical protein
VIAVVDGALLTLFTAAVIVSSLLEDCGGP